MAARVPARRPSTRGARIHAAARRYEQSCTSPSIGVPGSTRGFYYYDALDHQLVEVTKPTRELEQLCSSRPWPPAERARRSW